MDTFEELSNGFINKINEIKDKIQGKDDTEETKDVSATEIAEDKVFLKKEKNQIYQNLLCNQDSSFLPGHRNLRKRKQIKYFPEKKRYNYDQNHHHHPYDLKNSWKKSDSEGRVPTLRNSNDHYALMDFSHNAKKTSRKRMTL